MNNPLFSVEINGKDKTSLFQKRVESISVVDKKGFEADSLEIVLDDALQALPLPKRGEEIKLSLGWKGESLIDLGLWTVDESEESFAPDLITVRAKAVSFLGAMKAGKTREWHEVTFADVINMIAAENSLKPAVSDFLGAIEFDHITQTNESDLHLITRLARQYDAIAKPVKGHLLLIEQGEGKSVSGVDLPIVSIDRFDMTPGGTVSLGERSQYKSVTCSYRLQSGKKKTVKAGEGEPVFVIRELSANKSNAQSKAQSKLKKLGRSKGFISIPLSHADFSIVAGSPIKLADGFRDEYKSMTWEANEVVHTYTKSGLITQIEGEVSNG